MMSRGGVEPQACVGHRPARPSKQIGVPAAGLPSSDRTSGCRVAVVERTA